MWQAGHVRDKLKEFHPEMEIDIVGVKTEADKFLDVPLGEMGGKGAFIKELEQALLNGSADLAVHSMKDVTIDLPAGLTLPVILEREDVRDVLVSNEYNSLAQLPESARIGTSSLRRKCQLKALRPDLEIIDIRGNVGTRLKKLDDGLYDALVLAAAGVKRLGFHSRIKSYLETDTVLPAIGQGALGLETRSDRLEIIELISGLNDNDALTCVESERSFNRELNGGCHAPVAAYAEIKHNKILLTGLVGREDGSEILNSAISGQVEDAVQLGRELGRQFLNQGADKILREAGYGTGS